MEPTRCAGSEMGRGGVVCPHCAQRQTTANHVLLERFRVVD
jgi:hypothetical protein